MTAICNMSVNLPHFLISSNMRSRVSSLSFFESSKLSALRSAKRLVAQKQEPYVMGPRTGPRPASSVEKELVLLQTHAISLPFTSLTDAQFPLLLLQAGEIGGAAALQACNGARLHGRELVTTSSATTLKLHLGISDRERAVYSGVKDRLPQGYTIGICPLPPPLPSVLTHSCPLLIAPHSLRPPHPCAQTQIRPRTHLVAHVLFLAGAKQEAHVQTRQHTLCRARVPSKTGDQAQPCSAERQVSNQIARRSGGKRHMCWRRPRSPTACCRFTCFECASLHRRRALDWRECPSFSRLFFPFLIPFHGECGERSSIKVNAKARRT